MRKIITTTFVSMDGVMQAPGGSKEDTDEGFEWGGWSFGYWDDKMSKVMDGFMNQPFDLLLGRRTYEIFAAHWPNKKDDPVGDKFNAATKHVVSHDNMKLDWENSVLITGDVALELRKLKEGKGNDLWVHGSGNLVQTLLAHSLIDRMHIWVFPVTLGQGKRLFDDGTVPHGWRLIESKIADSGVIIATYEPAGDIRGGTFM